MSSVKRNLKRDAKAANKKNPGKLSQPVEEIKIDGKSYQFEEDLNFEASEVNDLPDQPSLEQASRIGGARKRASTHRSDNGTLNEGDHNSYSGEGQEDEGEKRKFISYEAEDGSTTIYHVPSFLLKTYEIVDVRIKYIII